MSKGPESTFWNWLKKGLGHESLKPNHVRRLENGVSTGDPDVEGCIRGRSFNVELKAVPAYKIRKDGSFALEHFTLKQAYWHDQRVKAGGRCWLLVRVGDDPNCECFLVHGSRSLEVFERRLQLTREYLRSVADTAGKVTHSFLWNRLIL